MFIVWAADMSNRGLASSTPKETPDDDDDEQAQHQGSHGEQSDARAPLKTS